MFHQGKVSLNIQNKERCTHLKDVRRIEACSAHRRGIISSVNSLQCPGRGAKLALIPFKMYRDLECEQMYRDLECEPG